jgi:hypothetical protein
VYNTPCSQLTSGSPDSRHAGYILFAIFFQKTLGHPVIHSLIIIIKKKKTNCVSRRFLLLLLLRNRRVGPSGHILPGLNVSFRPPPFKRLHLLRNANVHVMYMGVVNMYANPVSSIILVPLICRESNSVYAFYSKIKDDQDSVW